MQLLDSLRGSILQALHPNTMLVGVTGELLPHVSIASRMDSDELWSFSASETPNSSKDEVRRSDIALNTSADCRAAVLTSSDMMGASEL